MSDRTFTIHAKWKKKNEEETIAQRRQVHTQRTKHTATSAASQAQHGKMQQKQRQPADTPSVFFLSHLWSEYCSVCYTSEDMPYYIDAFDFCE